MPAEQRGQVYATAKGFGIRWYDERGARRRRAGFSSTLEGPSVVPRHRASAHAGRTHQ